MFKLHFAETQELSDAGKFFQANIPMLTPFAVTWPKCIPKHLAE